MLAMLWHAMAGCCAHHVHEETPHHHEHTSACEHQHNHVAADACHHRHAHHEGDSHEQHEHHGACNSSDCVFSMPDGGSELTGLSKAIGCQPYFDTACLISHESVPVWQVVAHPLRPDRQAIGSTRLHLQMQVLLI
ncbi:hypothetical protein C5Y97_02360 [Blastopirellula marina]|uniref:Uncharacterized protein n=2 Tax=Blastopirellula marina TaxID=124 RepID=A0A2S8GC75_9BACT|nr:hypothetical protein C5Y98_02360 [Blastopirellula marina]PTL46258.1 hypothetical protein C5Y97_02360 [Blastopirellula marina]